MAKQTTSFRLPELTQTKLAELADLFRESGAESVERAIDYLYEHREQEAKRDLEKRLTVIRKKDID